MELVTLGACAVVALITTGALGFVIGVRAERRQWNGLIKDGFIPAPRILVPDNLQPLMFSPSRPAQYAAVRSTGMRPEHAAPYGVNYPDLAEAWCEVALNGLQWLRNIVEFNSDPKPALENMEKCVRDMHAKNPGVFPPPKRRISKCDPSCDCDTLLPGGTPRCTNVGGQ